MARPEKATAVAEITESFEQADATLLTEYRGMRVAELAELRTALREADADYKVLKNTLTRIAVRQAGIEGLEDMLTGPTAIVFVRGDVAAAAKALDEAAKKFPVLVVKGGTLKGGKVFDAAQASALAKIEPREVLLAKVAMLMNSPAQQTANVLSALLRNLGSMLAQVVTKKESGELPGGAGEAPVAESSASEAVPSEEPEAAEEAASAGSQEAGDDGDAPEASSDADQGEAEADEAPAAEASDTSTDGDEDEAVKEEEE